MTYLLLGVIVSNEKAMNTLWVMKMLNMNTEVIDYWFPDLSVTPTVVKNVVFDGDIAKLLHITLEQRQYIIRKCGTFAQLVVDNLQSVGISELNGFVAFLESTFLDVGDLGFAEWFVLNDHLTTSDGSGIHPSLRKKLQECQDPVLILLDFFPYLLETHAYKKFPKSTPLLRKVWDIIASRMKLEVETKNLIFASIEKRTAQESFDHLIYGFYNGQNYVNPELIQAFELSGLSRTYYLSTMSRHSLSSRNFNAKDNIFFQRLKQKSFAMFSNSYFCHSPTPQRDIIVNILVENVRQEDIN